MEDASKYWPISIVATILVWLGYAPEFLRLYRDRKSSGIGIYMWILWTASSALSTLYAFLVSSSVLVVINIGTVCFLTIVSAVGNACFMQRTPSGELQSTSV